MVEVDTEDYIKNGQFVLCTWDWMKGRERKRVFSSLCSCKQGAKCKVKAANSQVRAAFSDGYCVALNAWVLPQRAMCECVQATKPCSECSQDIVYSLFEADCGREIPSCCAKCLPTAEQYVTNSSTHSCHVPKASGSI